MLNELRQALHALRAASGFIHNGVQLGFIRMPDPGLRDPAHQTPGLIDAAITSLASLEAAAAREPQLTSSSARAADVAPTPIDTTDPDAIDTLIAASRAHEAAEGSWYWIRRLGFEGLTPWAPAIRERNHWNSAGFSGIPHTHVLLGPVLCAPEGASAPRSTHTEAPSPTPTTGTDTDD